MQHRELWPIKESAAAQTVQSKEVAPLRAPICEIEAHGSSAKTAVGSVHPARWPGYSLAGARRHLDDDARLVAELCWRRAREHFQGLNRINGNLVRKDLALLIRDRLAVYGKRVFRMVSHSVGEAVRVRSDARG